MSNIHHVCFFYANFYILSLSFYINRVNAFICDIFLVVMYYKPVSMESNISRILRKRSITLLLASPAITAKWRFL
jgi:hypothetical protein